MLPFEDRYSRQRRLPEVGPEGQARLSQARLSVAPHPDLGLELDYLERAGVAAAVVDPSLTPLAFPWPECFEHTAALGVARGAWCALARIRAELLPNRP
jgi:hypothetical protein